MKDKSLISLIIGGVLLLISAGLYIYFISNAVDSGVVADISTTNYEYEAQIPLTFFFIAPFILLSFSSFKVFKIIKTKKNEGWIELN